MWKYVLSELISKIHFRSWHFQLKEYLFLFAYCLVNIYFQLLFIQISSAGIVQERCLPVCHSLFLILSDFNHNFAGRIDKQTCYFDTLILILDLDTNRSCRQIILYKTACCWKQILRIPHCTNMYMELYKYVI